MIILPGQSNYNIININVNVLPLTKLRGCIIVVSLQSKYFPSEHFSLGNLFQFMIRRNSLAKFLATRLQLICNSSRGFMILQASWGLKVRGIRKFPVVQSPSNKLYFAISDSLAQPL